MSGGINVKRLAESLELDEDHIETVELVIKEVFGTDRIGVVGAESIGNAEVRKLPYALSSYIDAAQEENGQIGTVAFTRNMIVAVELDERFEDVPTEELVTDERGR